MLESGYPLESLESSKESEQFMTHPGIELSKASPASYIYITQLFLELISLGCLDIWMFFSTNQFKIH